MNKGSIYWKDDQLSVNSKLLTMFSAPLTVWICGFIYFCQKEIVIFGREPLPVNSTVLLLVILGGYFLSSLLIAVIPRFTIWIERFILPAAAIATLLLLFPFPNDITVKIFYGIVFSVHFSIPMYASVVCHLFTVETAWKSTVLSIAIGGMLFAILLNDFYYIGFTIFIFASAILLILSSGFLYIIPGKIRVPLSTWRDKIKLPIIAFLGIMVLIALSLMLSVFSIEFASKAYHGLTFLFSSAAFFSLITLFAWIALRGKAIKAFILFFIMIIAGIVLAYLSDTYRQLYLVACVLLGFSISAAGFWPFLLSTVFSMHPTRFIGVIGTLIIIASISIASKVYNLIAEYTIVMFAVFGVISILLTLTYLILHKYFVYAFTSNTLGTNIKLVGQPFSLPHKVQSTRESHPFDELADTELMVVKMLLEGHTLFSIAFNMSIDMDTAKEYKNNIYKTLGIHSKSELFRMVYKQLYEF